MSHLTSGISFILALLLILKTLWDGFSFINLSRKTERGLCTDQFIEVQFWRLFRFIHRNTSSTKTKDRILTLYAPTVITVLIMIWLLCLIVGFAVLSWSFGEEIKGVQGKATFDDYLYLSGVTLFTLGYGDLSPASTFGHIYSLIEVACGYSFLAVIIGFVPTITSAYAEREVGLMRIQLQTGMTFSAKGILHKLVPNRDIPNAHLFFRDCSDWILKTYFVQNCYPILAYHRGKKRKATWLSGTIVLMDLAAISLAWFNLTDDRSAQNLFILGLEELREFCLIFDIEVDRSRKHDRISPEQINQLWQECSDMGFPMKDHGNPKAQLDSLLNEYYCYVVSLSEYLLIPIPGIIQQDIESTEPLHRIF